MSQAAETLGPMPGTIKEKAVFMNSTANTRRVGEISVALGQALEQQLPRANTGICIPMPIESFTEPHGLVRGAIENDQNAAVPQAAWMLPAGQTMSLEAGTAIAVLTRLTGRVSTWTAMELPKGGRDTRPSRVGVAEARSSR